MAQTTQTKTKKTFRFEFESDIIELIERFAIVHQYDERKMYKEQWNSWYNENKEQMEREIERMNDIGYVGDVKDKMFKAGRYYFRKKNIKNKEEQAQVKETQAQVKETQAQTQAETQAQGETINNDIKPHVVNPAVVVTEKKRRNYITMLEATLVAMDEHIKLSLATDADFKPSDGYSEFCEKNVLVLRTEIQRMVADNIMDKKDIADKIKKTYKNRYYMITKH
jgi:uncharacterized protein with von Willebrand factor type A (vWA) domain